MLLQGAQGLDRQADVPIAQAELVREFEDTRPHGLLVEYSRQSGLAGDQLAAQEDVLNGGQVRGEGLLLVNGGDPEILGVLGGRDGHWRACRHDRASGRLDRSGENVDQR